MGVPGVAPGADKLFVKGVEYASERGRGCEDGGWFEVVKRIRSGWLTRT